MIRLTEHKNGLITENDTGTDFVYWVRDTYSEPREDDFDCTDCGEPITEENLMTCLDGGDAAHMSCVTIERAP